MATKKAVRKKAAKKTTNQTVKATVKKRTLNATSSASPAVGSPFNDQDTKRRLGNFVGAGEHARVGGRTAGIVGQTKQKSRTDNRSKK